LIDAKSKKFFLAIYQNFLPIVKPIMIDEQEVDHFKKQYSNLKSYYNYQGINIYENFTQ